MPNDRGKPVDITGQQFGELTALEPTSMRKSGSVVWRCKCSCGAETFVPAALLRAGVTKSCGHLRGAGAKDITGQRFGRLVAVKPLKRRVGGNIVWLCKCDCGSVTAVSGGNLRRKSVQTCGRCIARGPGTSASLVKCPACGKVYRITLGGGPTPQFCPDCTPKFAGRNWKVCPACGKLFPSPASSKTITCSRECSSAWKRAIHSSVSNKWNYEARMRKREQGQTENLKKGTIAAQSSPICGRFETNREAKIWTLIDPSGNEVVVRNLLMWARANTNLFDKPEGDKSAKQIAAGFMAIAQTLRGKRKTPAMTYFGWTLKDVPKIPEE